MSLRKHEKSLPYSVEIDGKTFKIREKCDYRVAMDAIKILQDNELNENDKLNVLMYVFYESPIAWKYRKKAMDALYEIVAKKDNYANDNYQDNENAKPKTSDFEYDFDMIVPPINKVLGYDIRNPDINTHWWTFLAALEMIDGECLYARVLNIRRKRAMGKTLEKSEKEFFAKNRNRVILPQTLTEEDKEFLEMDF